MVVKGCASLQKVFTVSGGEWGEALRAGAVVRRCVPRPCLPSPYLYSTVCSQNLRGVQSVARRMHDELWAVHA
jgi:hypothetical protein